MSLISSGSLVSTPLAPIAPPQASVQAAVVVTSIFAVVLGDGFTKYQISSRCSVASSQSTNLTKSSTSLNVIPVIGRSASTKSNIETVAIRIVSLAWVTCSHDHTWALLLLADELVELTTIAISTL